MITCKACYYSETVRTLPSGCKYKCGMGRGKEENWRCERVWSRCIRKKDREVYGKVSIIRDSMYVYSIVVIFIMNFKVCAVHLCLHALYACVCVCMDARARVRCVGCVCDGV